MKLIIQRCVECDSTFLCRLPDPWNDIAECVDCGHPNDIIYPFVEKEISRDKFMTKYVSRKLKWSDYLILAFAILVLLTYCLLPLIGILYNRFK